MSPRIVIAPRRPAPEHAQLHRGQVLRLVHDQVAVRRGRAPRGAPAPRRGAAGRRPTSPCRADDWSSRCSSSSRIPSAAAASASGCGEAGGGRADRASGAARGRRASGSGSRPCGARPRCRRRSGTRRRRAAACTARRTRARASSAGGRGRRRGWPTRRRLLDERGGLVGVDPQLDPFEPHGEELGWGLGQGAHGRRDHIREPLVALQPRDAGSSRRAGSTPATSSSTARCSTRSSPSIGSTCEM